jgi:transposase-like protein
MAYRSSAGSGWLLTSPDTPPSSNRHHPGSAIARQGMAIADAVRQIGISELTYYRWRKQYGGMSRDQLRQLKELQKENERLRKAVADLTLDKLILREAASGNF